MTHSAGEGNERMNKQCQLASAWFGKGLLPCMGTKPWLPQLQVDPGHKANSQFLNAKALRTQPGGSGLVWSRAHTGTSWLLGSAWAQDVAMG